MFLLIAFVLAQEPTIQQPSPMQKEVQLARLSTECIKGFLQAVSTDRHLSFTQYEKKNCIFSPKSKLMWKTATKTMVKTIR